MKVSLFVLLFLVALSIFGIELSQEPTFEATNIDFPKGKESDKGFVKAFVELSKDGKIEKYGFLKSSGPDWEKALNKGFRKLKFSPAKYKDHAISIKIYFTYSFGESQPIKIDSLKENSAYKKEKEEIDKKPSPKAEVITLNDRETIVVVKNGEEAKQEATEAKQEATEAKQEATEVKQEATEVKQEATEVKQEATEVKQEATEAKQEATEAKQEATEATQEGSNGNTQAKTESTTGNTASTDSTNRTQTSQQSTLNNNDKAVETTTANTTEATNTNTDETKAEEAPTLSKFPELKKFVEANYPIELKKQKVEGAVLLFIDLDEAGKIINTGVIQTTNEQFNEPAIEAVKQFEFTPAEYQDKPVPVRITYQYNFVIKAEEKATQEEIEKAKKDETLIVETAEYDSVKGSLYAYGSREPIANALVYAIDSDKNSFETISDSDGKFLFKNLKDGEYTILVPEKDNFLRFESKEDVKKGSLVVMTVYIPKDDINPYELTVVSRKARKEVTKQTIQVQELLKVPGTSGDAIKVVQNLPGVSRAGGLSGQIIIRGSSNRESEIFIDGFRVPLLYHFGGLTSVYNSELLQDVSYFPGGYSVKYGRSLGGIIDVKTKDVITKKDNKNIHGFVDIDLIDTSAMVEIPIDDDSGVAVAFRRSYIDTVLPAILPDSVSDIVVALPVYYDWQLQYNNQFTKKDKFTFALYGSHDNFELYLGKPTGDPNIEGAFGFTTYFSTIKSSWEHKFSKNLVSDLSVGLQYSSNDIFLGSLLDFNISAWTILLRENLEYKLNSNITFNFGVDSIAQFYKADVLAPKFSSAEQNSAEFEPIGSYEKERQIEEGSTIYPAIYIEAIGTFGKFKAVPGVRFDYFQNSEQITVDPRLGVFYTLTDDWLLKGSAGVFHMPASIEQTDSFVGNPDTEAQYSIQYSLGAEYRFNDDITTSIEFFYNDQRDLIVSSDEKVVIDGEVTSEMVNNDGKGRAYGMELFIRHNLSKRFFGWISYTLMRAERKEHPWEDWELFRFDQTHILTILGSYKLPYGFEVGARLRYVTGSPETPITGSVFDSDNATYSPIYGEALSKRNEPFFQLDIRIDKTWQFKLWTLTAYLDVQNVTYYKNQEGVDYNYDYSESQKVEGLPIFPSFGIKGEW
ncbi:TonB family protein [bacterium]|nr:TonB family protein [bacterium]